MYPKNYVENAFHLWNKEIVPTEDLLLHVGQVFYPNTSLMMEAVEHVQLMDAEMYPWEEDDE